MGKTKSDTIFMIMNTHGKSSMKISSIYEWYNIFKNDSARDVADRQRSGRPNMMSVKTEEIRELLQKRFIKFPKIRSSPALTSGFIDGRSVYCVVENTWKRCGFSMRGTDFPDAVSNPEVSCPAQRNPTLT